MHHCGQYLWFDASLIIHYGNVKVFKQFLFSLCEKTCDPVTSIIKHLCKTPAKHSQPADQSNLMYSPPIKSHVFSTNHVSPLYAMKWWTRIYRWGHVTFILLTRQLARQLRSCDVHFGRISLRSCWGHVTFTTDESACTAVEVMWRSLRTNQLARQLRSCDIHSGPISLHDTFHSGWLLAGLLSCHLL